VNPATILMLIDELIQLLPVIIASGQNVAKLITAIDNVWAEASMSKDDPRFAEVAQRITDARSQLKARAAELNAAS